MYGIHLNKPRHFSCLHPLAGRKPGEIPPMSPLLTFQTILPPAQTVSLCGGAGLASHTALPRVLIPPGLRLLRTVTSVSPRHPSRAHSPRILLLNLLVKLGALFGLPRGASVLLEALRVCKELLCLFLEASQGLEVSVTLVPCCGPFWKLSEGFPAFSVT